MPQYDFKPPQSLKESLQRFTLELNCMMVWLRNEARFHDAMDYSVLETASLISDLLHESVNETEALLPDIERRVMGADLAHS
ncbi:MAG: hypothetical protein ACKOBC_03190 [Hyphomicrobiales bacterium]